MKCNICGGAGHVRLPHFNLKVCDADFLQLVERRVERAIQKFKMFDRASRVLVAVSGGKDSLSLWHALHRLGYAPDALFIRLGVTPEVERAQALVQKAAAALPGRLHVLDATSYFGGASVQEVARMLRRPVCAVCGLVRRYLMNKFACEHGYDVLATGHNMTDEATALLGNLLHWQDGYLQRQWPVLPKSHPRFAAKVKPLALNYEQDIKQYAVLRGIEHLEESCPFAAGATSRLYKRLLTELEQAQPGIIGAFYLGYIRRGKIQAEPVKLQDCQQCGYPTTIPVCAFCRLLEQFSRKRKVAFSSDSAEAQAS
ncbi:MAG: adenine nucleotide alpha hydrolase family protein [Verrucomicrobiae bacterium]|nr:adenine nucleotide alpha hydrolase family protein [Verrucomicrobiae bacterium]